MNLQPLGDRLIVEVLEEEETTVSGIVLPDTAKEKPQRGRVLAVGPGARDEDGERIFKVVSFFLVRYEGGRLGDVPEKFRHEVADVRWLPLEEAPTLLAYGGERDMARKALERLSEKDV